MSENSPQNDKRVTLEDLLKLKRHERPDPAYWERFQRELHEKTLRSLVKTTAVSPSGLRAFLCRWHPALPLTSAAAFVLLLAFSQGIIHLPTAPSAFEASPIAQENASSHVVAIADTTSTHSWDEARISGAPSYVVSAISSRSDSSSDQRYTQVAASKVLAPAHRPEVQFVSGAMASHFGMSLPGTVGSVGVY
jgi:hypothetical protein